MTTIAYKDGILAADTLLACGYTIDGYASKIGRRGTDLIAASGDTALCQAFMEWAKGSRDAPPPPMHVDGGQEGDYAIGYIFLVGGALQKYHPRRPASTFLAPFYAYGSGGWLALGAMEAGASAEEAVRIAARWDMATGGDVETLRHLVAKAAA